MKKISSEISESLNNKGKEDDEMTIEVTKEEITGIVQKELSSSSPNVFRTARKQIVHPTTAKTSLGPGNATEKKMRHSVYHTNAHR